MLVVGSGSHEQQTGQVRILEIARGVERFQWPHTGPVYSTSCSPDGTTIAAGSGVLKTWNLKTGKEQATLSHGAHVHGISALAYAPDGRTLASLGYWQDKATLLLWDVPGSKLTKELVLPDHANHIAFAADGRHLAVADANGTVYILRIAETPPHALSTEEAKKQQKNAAKRLDVPVQIENSIGMKLNLIPAGRFLMGSPENEPDRQAEEGPQHVVTITRPFCIGIYEVRQAEYERVTGKNPSKFNKDNGGGPDHPVEMVSWKDSVAFCKILSDLPEEKKAGRVYRLPTEAEWEYACRARTQTTCSFGDDPKLIGSYGWCLETSGRRTHAVGRLQANAWGLYDMHGNVWEWCADWFDANYYANSPQHDPPGARSGSKRVHRDNGHAHRAVESGRSAFRVGGDPDYSSDTGGFRVVCDCRPPQITNSIGMKLARIPAGKFLMGSPETEPGRLPNEGPQHEVTISRPFHIGVYEVTQAEYDKVTGTNPSQFNKDNGGGPKHPVEMVSWHDAVAFCKKLSELPEEKKAGRVYRLPTEAEWEYACRAGTQTAYSFGDTAEELERHGWVAENAKSKTYPVGQLLPNAWGLHDMLGNVSEWCMDTYRVFEYKRVIDPQGPAIGVTRALRGGLCNEGPARSRSASRYGNDASGVFITTRQFNVGFRVICD
jgi:formylglycine-generating enzyme required for sulfatase activity